MYRKSGRAFIQMIWRPEKKAHQAGSLLVEVQTELHSRHVLSAHDAQTPGITRHIRLVNALVSRTKIKKDGNSFRKYV